MDEGSAAKEEAREEDSEVRPRASWKVTVRRIRKRVVTFPVKAALSAGA